MLNVVRLGLARAAYSIGMTQIASNGHLISLKWDLQSHKEGIKTNVKSHVALALLHKDRVSSRVANPLCESGSQFLLAMAPLSSTTHQKALLICSPGWPQQYGVVTAEFSGCRETHSMHYGLDCMETVDNFFLFYFMS